MSRALRKVFVLTGPTSSGKTAVASSITHLVDNVVVVNADSKQVYAELPILTSQGSSGCLYGYVSVFDRVPSVFSWMRDCASCLEAVWEQNKFPLVVGGTPMYIYSLLHGISVLPALPNDLVSELSGELGRLGSSSFIEYFASRLGTDASYFPRDSYKLLRSVAYLIHTGKTLEELYKESGVYKIPYDSIDLFSIIPADRDFLYSSVNRKFTEAIDSGALEEVEAVLQNEEVYKNRAVTTICGFREISSYLRAEISFDQMLEAGQRSIRNYAKRQLTWFRNKFSEMKVFSQPSDVERYVVREAQFDNLGRTFPLTSGIIDAVGEESL